MTSEKELERRLASMEKKLDETIALLNSLLYNKPYSPYPPEVWPPLTTNNTCSVCGMEFKGVMGYVCPRSDCPSNVTC